MGVTNEQLKGLADKMDYKYRLQSAKNNRATIVSYIDSRQLQQRLDDVVGAANWQTDYKLIDGKLFGGIGINTEESGWVWKWDVGTESNQDSEKGQISDASKRAGVAWSIGRFLYSLGVITLKTGDYNNKQYPATDEGNILWSVDELTEYCKKVVASGELDRTRRGVKPLTTGKTPPAKQAPVKEDKPVEDADDKKRRDGALKALQALNKEPEILKHLVKDLKLTHASVQDFCSKADIKIIEDVYNKMK